MELISTITCIEGYAAEAGDEGMFITITTPSKMKACRFTVYESLSLTTTPPHWHMILFTKPDRRQQVIDRAMKEDGDERGAANNCFDCKHMNRGGAAGYIAKYIAKNIDG